ncbi:MAG: hypothetical protein LBS06_04700 [Treponema sp.]|jgi:hypothetical protein|nr:hypothetical protein [Treponema sp.]
MKFHVFFAIPVLALSSVLLVSCPDAMSFSWGTWAKRDPKIPSITSSNIKELLKEAVGDPEFAKALLRKIKDSAKGASGERKAMLEGAGISAAALASGLDTLILSKAGTLINAAGSDNPDGNAIAKVMEDIFNQAKGTDQTAIAKDLVELFADEDLDNPNSAIIEHTDTDKLIISAMVLLIAEAQETSSGNFNTYLDNFAERQGSGTNLTKNEETALKLAAIVAGAEGGAEGMGDLFEFLKL